MFTILEREYDGMQSEMRGSDFIQTIGVIAHIDLTSSSYGSSDVLGQLAYLGIDNVRVEAPYTNVSSYLALGQAGIHFDVISSNTNLAQQIGYLNSIAPYVTYAEGPNEVNTDPVSYAGLTGAAAADAYQRDYYAAVHADPALANASVLPFSLSVGGSLTGYGNVSASADDGNVHGYAGNGVPPYYMLSYAISSVTTTPGKPVVMTETGYYTDSDGQSGVSQDVQAKWLIDTLLQNAATGVVKTYLYQLEDGYNDSSGLDPENHYGLFTTSGVAKESAFAIHNLTTILADNGTAASSFTPASWTPTITGLSPDYGFDTVFAKSNGSFDVALWSEPQFYNPATGIATAVTPSMVTIKLGGTYNVSVYDPIVGTAAIITASAANSITLALGTDPLIVEVSPVGASMTPVSGPLAPPPMPSSPAPASPATPLPTVTLGSGPSSITVGVSEDAYGGDAQFTLAVDGVQIGGVQTATALHSLQQSQSFVLDGTFSAGAHTVTASFLNDAYGGSTTLDRNLHIDTITAGGTTTPVAATLFSNGSQNFTATLPATNPASPAGPLPTVTLGSGASSITVGVSEDAYGGDAQFTLAVDGVQIGGVQTATALHSLQQSQSFVLDGTFSAGAHTVTASFLNDAYGGSTTLDRNLHIDTITAGGTTTPVAATLFSNGSQNFTATLPATNPASPAGPLPTVTLGSGASSITVGISEDAYGGDAQFTLAVDGVQIGGVQTATALHSLQQSQSFVLDGNFSAGAHTVTASFLNDAYGGSTTLDRNLHIDTITAGGTTTPVAATLFSNGSQNFTATLPTAPSTHISAASVQPTSGMSFASPASPAAATPLVVGPGTVTTTLVGNGTVQAGTGADTFSVAFGNTGNQVIDGFKPATDVIHLTGFGIADPASSVVVGSSGSVLSLPGGTVLNLVNAHGLTKANFT